MTKFNHWLYLVFTLVVFTSAQAQPTSQALEENLSITEAEEKVNALGAACWKLRVADSDSAAILGEQALSLAKKYNIRRAIPRISNYLGVVYVHCLHRKKNSIPYFYQALEIGIQIQDSIQIAYAYNNLGDAYFLHGNVPLSKFYTEKSIQIFKSLDNPMGIAYGYVNMGLANQKDKDYKAALYYFEKAKTIREENGDKTGLASLTLEIGKNYLDQNELDSAMIYFQESYKKHIAINNLIYLAYSLNEIANIYYQREQYDKAYAYFNKSIKLNQKEDNYYGLIDNYNGLALVCAKQNKKEEGEEALLKALEMSNMLNLSSKTLQTHRTFAKFYEAAGDYKKATNSLSQFVNLYDSVFSVQQVETLEELQKNFSIRQNLSKTQMELAANETKRIYLLIIIALMLILSSIVVLRLRAKQNLNRQLKEINTVKDKMFSVISHDLKSPFNSLLGFSNLLNEELEEKNYTNLEKYSKIIHQKSEESYRLLSNLLTWSQTQTGRIGFNPQNMSLDFLFKELKNLFKTDANKNNVQLHFTNDTPPNINSDIDILRIVLVNLISNSLKYTEEYGKIEVEAMQTDDQIILKVSDTGIGMASNTLQNLFKDDQYIQSVEGLRNEQGTGLGLLISTELIHIHKGRISAESELGKGSVFSITLPKMTE